MRKSAAQSEKKVKCWFRAVGRCYTRSFVLKGKKVDTTRLSSKGQVMIPKGVREAHGWAEGIELSIEDLGNAIILRPIRMFPLKTVDEVFGILKYARKAKTIEDMQAGIDSAMTEIWDRKRK